ncbi:MAG TPA: cytochrome c [Candidatus Polarisedimenticolaceae bacterium]|nr:cytochrome c [Candidatus Polarisedimenticolaceae bacterium]
MRKIGLAVMILGLVAFVAGPAFSEDGAAVYKAKCAMCHGDNGVAKKMAEPSRNLNDPKFQEAVSKDEIVKILTEGKGKKKSMKDKLTPEQIAAAADYVKTLK